MLINAHLAPRDVDSELLYMEHVFSDATTHFNESDVMLMGDLNTDCIYYKEEKVNVIREKYTWLISDDEDTNVAKSDCTYDRMIATPSLLEDYTGQSGVFRFDQFYDLTIKETKKVSDHYPVFTVFNIVKDTD